jgi:hypothetical protein
LAVQIEIYCCSEDSGSGYQTHLQLLRPIPDHRHIQQTLADWNSATRHGFIVFRNLVFFVVGIALPCFVDEKALLIGRFLICPRDECGDTEQIRRW